MHSSLCCLLVCSFVCVCLFIVSLFLCFFAWLFGLVWFSLLLVLLVGWLRFFGLAAGKLCFWAAGNDGSELKPLRRKVPRSARTTDASETETSAWLRTKSKKAAKQSESGCRLPVCCWLAIGVEPSNGWIPFGMLCMFWQFRCVSNYVAKGCQREGAQLQASGVAHAQ